MLYQVIIIINDVHTLLLANGRTEWKTLRTAKKHLKDCLSNPVFKDRQMYIDTKD